MNSSIMNPFTHFLTKNSCFGFLGTLCFSSGVTVLLLYSWFFDFLIASMLVLKPNSLTLEVWRKPPLILRLDFYFFNWTNPEEINDLTKKPKFREIGPYSFIEHKEKVNLTWNDNNTITYRQLRHWYFDEKNSAGKLSDQVVTLNAVAMSAANQIKDWSYFMKKGLSFSLAAVAPHVHIVKPVGQLLFEGYDDPLVDMALTMPFLAETLPPFDKFGWFYMRNQSYTFDGVFNMATGVDNTLGELRGWNYYNETPYLDKACSQVHGSAAELYPQRVTRDNIGFFSPDMCRYVKLDYEKDEVIKGMKGYKYSAQHGMLDNGTIVPGNECYCNGDCVPSGMLNVSSCRYGTPAFVSLPHFYDADPMYLSLVEGLQPNKSLHELFITLEPRTGIALDVAIRLQLNIMTFPIEYITLFEDVPTIYFPMLWFEQKASIPDDVSWMLWILLSLPTILPVLASLMIIIGLISVLYITRLFVKQRLYKRNLAIIDRHQEGVPLKSSKKEFYSPKKRKANYLDLT